MVLSTEGQLASEHSSPNPLPHTLPSLTVSSVNSESSSSAAAQPAQASLTLIPKFTLPPISVEARSSLPTLPRSMPSPVKRWHLAVLLSQFRELNIHWQQRR
ncbi:MAG: hypothetical protein FRX48_04820 [Lasallia pustulata]|uniref:Uncharacterized protein n=1 Tax=Lasallia pustulata TaxID=136370 RepID=A0A5M8PPW3_9LECA|nr:MAG: hypothetical protein FRX48_04820 [Lasallia pustulata]